MTRTRLACLVALFAALGAGAQTRPVDATDAALDRPIHDLQCVGLTLPQAVDLIARKAGVSCRIDAKALEGYANGDKTQVGDFSVRRATARVALEMVLNNAAGEGSPLYVEMDVRGSV